MFFIIFMSVIAVAWGYVGWRIIIPANLPLAAHIAAWCLLALLWILPPLPWFLRPLGVDKSIVAIISWFAYIGLGFMTLLFFTVLFRDLGWIVFSGYQKISSFLSFKQLTVNELNADRRQFIIQAMNLGILGFTSAAVGFGYYQARRKPRIIKIKIPIDNLPSEFEGFRIAQFSDLHVGPTIKGDFVETVVKEIEALNADMIAFTGDLVDGSVADLASDVAALSRLKAPFGKYFITGNHEYYSGVVPWLIKAEELGFKILLDQHETIMKGSAKLTIAGVTDYSSRQFVREHTSDPIKAILNAPQNSVKILLAHQPKNIYKAAEAGYDLQLSGHTHGGQFTPLNLFSRLFQPYITGLSRHENTWIYVNRGTGYWGPPLRLGITSEITLITLTNGNPNKQ